MPPVAVSVPLKFMREGIRYDELSEEEKDDWDSAGVERGREIPDEVAAAELNQFLFNADTVDKVLATLMTDGLKVAGGDRLGKTIIFAKNQKHAEFISERFDLNYPEHAGHFARVITHGVTYAQSLIDDFSIKDKAPHIAISVDMLDTGIDVPEVRQPGLLQAGARQEQVLADDRPRHPAVPGPVRAGGGQEELLRLRLLPEPRVLRPGPARHRGVAAEVSGRAALRDPPRPGRRPRPGRPAETRRGPRRSGRGRSPNAACASTSPGRCTRSSPA